MKFTYYELSDYSDTHHNPINGKCFRSKKHAIEFAMDYLDNYGEEKLSIVDNQYKLRYESRPIKNTIHIKCNENEAYIEAQAECRTIEIDRRLDKKIIDGQEYTKEIVEEKIAKDWTPFTRPWEIGKYTKTDTIKYSIYICAKTIIFEDEEV
jgi:hypothetical protein